MLEPLPLDRYKNAAVQVHTQLREWIVSGRLKPGDLVSEPKMAECFGVSRTPIREAIKKLAEESLLKIYPQVGSIVAAIDVEVVRDSQFIRETLEARTVELAAASATPEDVSHLRRIIEQQKVLVEGMDRDGFFISDNQLHEMLMQMSGHRSAWRIVQTIRAQIDRLRYLSLADTDWLEGSFAEHLDIVNAVADGNAASALEAMRVHQRRVLAAIDRMIAAHPEFFHQPSDLKKPNYQPI